MVELWTFTHTRTNPAHQKYMKLNWCYFTWCVVTLFHTFLPVWHIWEMPRKCQIKKKPMWHLHVIPIPALLLSGRHKWNGSCFFSVFDIYSQSNFLMDILVAIFPVVAAAMMTLTVFFEVIKLSAHLCSNFHNIFKGHRMFLIFVPLHFYLLRDLLSSWTLLKRVFQKLVSERGCKNVTWARK